MTQLDLIKHKFKNAVDNISNMAYGTLDKTTRKPADKGVAHSTARINADEIRTAYKNLDFSEFWSYVDEMGVREFVKEIL